MIGTIIVFKTPGNTGKKGGGAYVKKSLFVCLGMVLMLSLLIFGPAGTADANYPVKPIQLIVTYPPGGATDFQARIMTMTGEKHFGQPIVIINKAGAGGMTGWNWFVTSAPKDSHTLVTYNLPHFIAQSIVSPDVAKYDRNSFEPIGNWGADPAVLIVPADSPFNSVQDLVNFAKKNPGAVTFSGAGKYVGHHIALLQLEKAAGIKTTYVPHDGGVPALLSVVSKKVMAGFNNLSDAFRSQDRIKIIGIADMKRSSFIPDVKTFKEMGINVDDASNNYRGIAAPKGTPPEIIKQLSNSFSEVVKDKGTLEKMEMTGGTMSVLTREEVIEMFKRLEVSLRDVLAEFIK